MEKKEAVMEKVKWEVQIGVCYSNGTWETKSVLVLARSERKAEKKAYKKLPPHDDIQHVFTLCADLAP